MTEGTLSGKTALVTGAARRIGKAIALDLASRGASIAAHYRSSKEEAEALRREVEAYNVRCRLFPADFDKSGGFENLIDAVFAETGGVDILVNSASIFPPGTIWDVSWEDLISNIRINAWAPFYISRSFARRAGAGVIVNLLDTKIKDPDRQHVAYILSKQLLESMTRLMAVEFAPRIRVNAVAPGLILPPPGQDDSYLENLNYTIPLKRHGNVGQIAEAVSFLIRNEFITGQTLFVDGGRHLAGY